MLRPAVPLPVSPLQPSVVPIAREKRHNPTLVIAAAKRRRTLQLETSQANLDQSLSDAFLQEISSSHIRESVGRYEVEIPAASKKGICCSCGSILPDTNIYRVDNDNPLLLPLEGILDTYS